MDVAAWDAHIDEFYESVADGADPLGSVERMRQLLVIMADEFDGATPALIAFEMAGIHDSMGLEVPAVPLYEEALASGLDKDHAGRARIQLGSTLRSLGRTKEAIEVLTEPTETEDDPARRAFLALALHHDGESAAALRMAIEALVPSLPRYGRSLANYARAELPATER
jgi:tetratricopeptide (TPR) repeat protein